MARMPRANYMKRHKTTISTEEYLSSFENFIPLLTVSSDYIRRRSGRAEQAPSGRAGINAERQVLLQSQDDRCRFQEEQSMV